ncbi:hypothetical protein NIES22_70490 (plasmid) [Calothrix brevissima NIES-22]|nr:hypothetical protein NIES22_70490 [Calothrix brevissima NIES-22]
MIRLIGNDEHLGIELTRDAIAFHLSSVYCYQN